MTKFEILLQRRDAAMKTIVDTSARLRKFDYFEKEMGAYLDKAKFAEEYEAVKTVNKACVCEVKTINITLTRDYRRELQHIRNKRLEKIGYQFEEANRKFSEENEKAIRSFGEFFAKSIDTTK